MLRGETIRLRQVRERDLDALYDIDTDIANRGAYYPTGTMSEPEFKRAFQETGFWSKDEGMLLIVDGQDMLLGQVEFFRTLNYLDELELGYRLFSPAYAGRGIATEAVTLMTAYLFDRTKFNRIRLIIHPENAASLRIAEKCGYRHEGTARGAIFHHGRYHDVEVYAMVREDFDSRNRAPPDTP
ncbi:MAG: GNAT family N-acetyltransferase [Thermomicrobiales bacterium]|nr:GNAT family N-acetyltransferase [Thermomicrobiales bacterium]